MRADLKLSCSSHHVLLFERLGAQEVPGGYGGDDHKDKYGHDRRHLELAVVLCELVYPGYEDICRACKLVARVYRVAVRQEVDDVEVIEVRGEGHNEQRRGGVEHERQCDAAKFLPWRSAVYPRGLQQLRRDAGHDAGHHGHEVWETQPEVDDEDDQLGQRRVREPGYVLILTYQNPKCPL